MSNKTETKSENFGLPKTPHVPPLASGNNLEGHVLARGPHELPRVEEENHVRHTLGHVLTCQRKPAHVPDELVAPMLAPIIV